MQMTIRRSAPVTQMRACGVVLCFLIAAWLPPSYVRAAVSGMPAEDAQVKAFIEQMVSRHAMSSTELEALFREASFSQEVLDAFSRTAESKPWHEYRKIFLKPNRIEGGAEFWRQNKATLDRAEATYGVPPEVVVSIIGVETLYGRYKGRIRVLDSLTTLAFRYPRRAKFFRGELEALLLLMREESLAVTTLKGSYAGAVGLPQFIPTSYRAYAVDFDNDGRRDLLGNVPDAIGSVANYLSRHRWAAGESVALRVSGVDADDQRLAKRSLMPKLTVETLRNTGVAGLRGALPAGNVTLFALRARPKREYWVGYQNFYAITRYNPSKLYAMAVFQLSQAIRDAYFATDR